MGITSSSILREAGRVTFNGAVLYSGDGAIAVSLSEERFAIKADMFPKIQDRPKDRRYEIKMPLVGEWEHLSVLWPYGSTVLGTKLFNNTPLKINTRSGKLLQFSNVAVTQCPAIRAVIGQTLIGDVTFTALLKDGGDPGDVDAYVIEDDESYGADAFSIAAIKTPIWTNAWGASPFDAFHTSGGMTFDFPITLDPVLVDGLGTVNMTLTDRMATAKGTPTGLEIADILTACDANSVMGAAPTMNALNVSGTGVYIRLYNASVRDPSLNYHNKTDTIGELTWTANQGFTSNVADPLYYVGTAAPV